MQTSYSLYQGKAIEGMLADAGNNDVMSYACEESSGILFGLAVCPGTDPDNQCKLPASAGDVAKVLGIAIHQYKEQDANGVAKYLENDTVSVCKKGRVWVMPEDTVTAGDAVYIRQSSGTGTQLGAFRNDADSATCTALSNAKFITSTSATGQLAVVEVNLI